MHRVCILLRTEDGIVKGDAMVRRLEASTVVFVQYSTDALKLSVY